MTEDYETMAKKYGFNPYAPTEREEAGRWKRKRMLKKKSMLTRLAEKILRR